MKGAKQQMGFDGHKTETQREREKEREAMMMMMMDSLLFLFMYGFRISDFIKSREKSKEFMDFFYFTFSYFGFCINFRVRTTPL